MRCSDLVTMTTPPAADVDVGGSVILHSILQFHFSLRFSKKFTLSYRHPFVLPNTTCSCYATGSSFSFWYCRKASATTTFATAAAMKMMGLTASQSSTLAGTPSPVAWKAIDGVTANNADSCATTQAVSNSWWRVDFAGIWRVDSLTISNSASPTLLDSAVVKVGSSCTRTETTCSTLGTGLGASFTVTCAANSIGDYLIIYAAGSSGLSICEVAITGGAAGNPSVFCLL